MSGTHAHLARTTRWRLICRLALWAWLACLFSAPGPALAQKGRSSEEAAADRPAAGEAAIDLDEKLREAEQMAEKAVAAEPADQQPEAELPVPLEPPERINLLQLLVKGRWLMLPIGLMSVLVVAIGAERFLGLRRGKVLPPKLVAALENLAGQPEGFDPRQAYSLCRQHQSAASTVIQTMLLKVGRPHSELEHAIGETSQREAARLYSNVRWLNLAAAVTPLLGLLGTVWGMIQAFFLTANLPVEANRAQVLADGIWTALVTTFAGLAVAIPAAVLAHYFEGRIHKLFRDLDETLFDLLPYLERYEGRLRLTKAQLERPEAPPIPPVEPAARGSKKRKPAASAK